jgi:hypothetical protein
MLCIVDPRLTHPVFTQLQSGDILSFDLVAKTLKARRPSLEAVACEAMCNPSARSAIEPKASPAAISMTIMPAVIPVTAIVRVSPFLRRSWPKEWL